MVKESEKLLQDVVRELKKGGDSDLDVTRALHRAYKVGGARSSERWLLKPKLSQATDASLGRAIREDSGSTAVTALIRVHSETGERKLYVSNCGDARAVLW